MTPHAEGAASLIAAAKAEQRTLVLCFDEPDAVVIGECALRETIVGSEIRVRVAAQTQDGVKPEHLFVRASVNGFCGPYVRRTWPWVIDLLSASRDSNWPRVAMSLYPELLTAMVGSLESVVLREVGKVQESLDV